MKKKRVDKAQKDFNEQVKNLEELFQNEGALNQSKETLQKFLDSKIKQKQDYLRNLNVRKKEYFKVGIIQIFKNKIFSRN